MRAAARQGGGWSWLFMGLVVLLPVGSARAAMPAGSDAGVPLPPGISAWRAPTTVNLGASALQVYSAMTTIPEEDLIDFYRQVLPQTGWQIERLPWQAQQDIVTDHLQKAMKEQHDSSVSSGLKAQLDEFKDAQQAMQRQIYASRGSEHVIVNLWPMGRAGAIAIFINRWSGDQTWLEQASSGAGEGPGWSQESGWPQRNVCCSGQAVPGLSVLPFSIPWYPGATAVAKSVTPGGETTVILMSPDAADAIAAFYLKQLPSAGWKLQKNRDVGGTDGSNQQLVFQKPAQRCVMTIQPGTTASEGAPPGQTMLTVAASVLVAH